MSRTSLSNSKRFSVLMLGLPAGPLTMPNLPGHDTGQGGHQAVLLADGHAART